MPATTLEPFPGELDKFQFMFILNLRAIVKLRSGAERAQARFTSGSLSPRQTVRLE